MVPFAPFSMHEGKSFAFKIGCYWKSHKKQYYTSAIFFSRPIALRCCLLLWPCRHAYKIAKIAQHVAAAYFWFMKMMSSYTLYYMYWLSTHFFSFPKWYSLEWSAQTLSFLKVFHHQQACLLKSFRQKPDLLEFPLFCLHTKYNTQFATLANWCFYYMT